MARVLVASGVKPGDRVAAQAEKSVPALVLYLAAVRSGAVYLPLNTAYTLNELEYFIGDAEPSLVVCDPSRAEPMAAIAAKVGAKVMTLGADGAGTLTDAASREKPDFETVARADDDLAAILYTSGTTGRSKGAMLTHDNLASNSLTLVDYWRFSERDVLIHALPIYHTHGLFVASNVVLFAGASMIFLPKFDPDLIVKLMARATVMMGVPTFYTRLLQNAGLTRNSTRHMRLFVSGSAPLLAETHREWSARTGHAVLERYGMTETNMNTSNPYEGDRVPGAVGFPLPGVSARITDPETGKLLGPETIGMIEVKGPNVFKGYWRMPEKTKAEFRDDGFFITGDLGKIDDRGYVHILGRGKDLVISGGFNVYPKEIESEIDAMPGVVEAAVIGVPHADFGEGVTAVVVRNPGADHRRSRGAQRARRPARQVQDAEAGDLRRRIAAQRHGQGAEEHPARHLCRAVCQGEVTPGQVVEIWSARFPTPSWPGLTRPSTLSLAALKERPWMPGTSARRRASRFSPGMTTMFCSACHHCGLPNWPIQTCSEHAARFCQQDAIGWAPKGSIVSRARRLLDLIQLLRRHRYPVSGAEMADELGVSLRTLYRDIDTLKTQGAGIDGEPGVGYVLRPGFMLPPLMFSEDEIEALVLGGRWVAARTDEPLGKAARNAIAKIAAVLPDDLKRSFDTSTLLIGPDRRVAAGDAELPTLRQAIRAERKLRITYAGADDKATRRTIWPFALGFFERVRVVVAWCEMRRDFRHFRTDRICKLQLTESRYPRRRMALLKEWRALEKIPPQ